MCPDLTPNAIAGYSLYFSDSFITNFISIYLQTYPGYQKMLFNSKLKTGNFQWRLIDLEFVFQSFGEYEDKFMNNINFECSVRPDFSESYANNTLSVYTQWDCIGRL